MFCNIIAAARSEASVSGRRLAGVAGFNPAGSWMPVFFVNVACWRIEVFAATGRSLVQKSPTECDQVQQ